jgi:predicted short-subunit dehydrogenase-like oxidoreductase (DUF2520 family)
MNITIVGAGRAGSSFAGALTSVGHDVTLVHHDELDQLASPQLILLTVPDDAIGDVALAIAPSTNQVVAHVAGSLSLGVLGPHPRVGSIHPLMLLPSGELGARRLVGATYSVAGDELMLVITLRDDQRTAYHATAAVAANHLVALMGHVGHLAESAGLSLEDFLPLAQQALADVAAVGPRAALTGPASRGDMATIDAHLAAIPESQRSTYVALANAAFELAEQQRSQTLA